MSVQRIVNYFCKKELSRYHYKVYGLHIGSALELPELIPARNTASEVDIGFGSIPEHLPEVRGSGVLFEASFNDFLFKYEGIGRIRVQNGNRIIIQAEKGALMSDIRLVLLGSGLGALLHQRGMLAIHGSAITNGRHTAIITGPSGVGKSSLAAGLFELGFSVIADDISVICENGNSQFKVAHGIPHLKLWKDVLNHLNHGNELTRVRPQLEKYRKPISLPAEETPGLSKVVVINPSNERDFSCSEVLGNEKFHLLRSNTYRLRYIDKMDRTEAHFRNLSRLVPSVQVVYVNRPYHPLNIFDFATYVSGIIFEA